MSDVKTAREQFLKLLHRIPISVLEGDAIAAQEYKKWAATATRAVTNPRAKLADIASHINRYHQLNISKKDTHA